MSSGHLDLGPAARRMAVVVEAVPDDALARPTSCEEYTVGDLLDHIDGAAGRVALDELVIHAWDLARGAGLAAPEPGTDLEPVFATVQQFRASGIEELFGPPVPVSEDAPLLDRVLGLTGRDPAWPPGRR